MSNMREQAFTGRHEERRALRSALQALHAQRISDQRVADLLSAYLDGDRIPGYPKASTAPVSRPTIQRIRVSDDRTLISMRPSTVGTLYTFLRHCAELPTELFDDSVRIHSSHAYAPLLEALERHVGANDGPLSNASLRSLEGAFHLYRKAWTSPSSPTYLRCVLRFEWVGDALFYTEEQRFTDTVARVPVDEIDQGVVMPYGMNVVLIGRGQSKDLLKFFSIHEFEPFPDGHLHVHAFAGNFIAVYSKGPHPGFRAYAQRVADGDEASCAFITEDQMDETILGHLTR